MSKTSPLPSSTSPSSSTVVVAASSTRLGSALDLELSLLRLIIDRASNQHRRTRYHRRLRMALRRIGEGRYNLHAMAGILGRCSHERVRLSSEFGRRRRRLFGGGGEERWVAISGQGRRQPGSQPVGDVAIGANGDDSFLPPPDEGTLADLTSWLRLTIDRSIPESISLLHFAADALYAEIGRGFFLPLATASLACVARVRSILLNMGRMAVEELVYTGALAREVLSAVAGGGGCGDPSPSSSLSHSIPWLGVYGSLERIAKDCGDLTMADVRRFAEVSTTPGLGSGSGPPGDSSIENTPSSSPPPPPSSSSGTKRRKGEVIEDTSSSPERIEDGKPSGSFGERGEEEEEVVGGGATGPAAASAEAAGDDLGGDAGAEEEMTPSGGVDDDAGLRVDGTVDEDVTTPGGHQDERASLERRLLLPALGKKKRKRKRASSPMGGGDRGTTSSGSSSPTATSPRRHAREDGREGEVSMCGVRNAGTSSDAGGEDGGGGGGGDDAAAIVEDERRLRRGKKRKRREDKQVEDTVGKEAKKKKSKKKKRSGASIVDDIFSGLC